MHTIVKQWQTKAGLPAVVILIPHEWDGGFHHCGYVAVDNKHPLYGVEYDEQCPAIKKEMVEKTPTEKLSPILLFTCTCDSDGDGQLRRSPDTLISVHGGLTHSSKFNRDEWIGRKSDYINRDNTTYPQFHSILSQWWFGFDLNHYMDHNLPAEYAEQECESMAEQLAAIS